MSRRKPRIGDIVWVVWADTMMVNLHWAPLDKYRERLHLNPIHTAGVLILSEKDRVGITLSVDPENHNADQATVIPRVMVQSITVLARPDKRLRKGLA